MPTMAIPISPRASRWSGPASYPRRRSPRRSPMRGWQAGTSAWPRRRRPARRRLQAPCAASRLRYPTRPRRYHRGQRWLCQYPRESVYRAREYAVQLFTALGEGNVQLGSDPEGDFSFQPTYEGVTLTQPEGSVPGLARNLRYTGSGWLYSQTNILGTDPADPSRYQAITNILVPVPGTGCAAGQHLRRDRRLATADAHRVHRNRPRCMRRPGRHSEQNVRPS